MCQAPGMMGQLLLGFCCSSAFRCLAQANERAAKLIWAQQVVFCLTSSSGSSPKMSRTRCRKSSRPAGPTSTATCVAQQWLGVKKRMHGL